VKALELKAPRLSTLDAKVLRGQVLGGEIFGAFSEQERVAIWGRLQAVDGLIPSLFTFFEDVKYLEACANCVKRLVSLSPRDTVSTALEKAFCDANQRADRAVIQVTESSFTCSPASLADRVDLGYRQLHAYAMRHYLQMPREPKGKELLARLMVNTDETVLRDFADLADRLGFESPEITALKQCPKSTVARARSERSKPLLVTDGAGEIKKRRCGLPRVEDYVEDGEFLFVNHLHNEEEEQGEGITSFFVRKSVYFAFFGRSIPLTLDSIPRVSDRTDEDMNRSQDTHIPQERREQEQQRQELERQEQQRQEQERLERLEQEQQRLELERLELERLELERQELERQEQEQERQDLERQEQEQERLEQEQEQERQKQEILKRLEQERQEQERQEQERSDKERLERERLREKQKMIEQERLKKERLKKEERERQEQEERERQEQEERERQEQEQRERQEQEERKRQEQEERKRQEQEEREIQEQEERERQEQEERERQEQEERERQEQEERERQEQEERKRQEQEERKRQEQEERKRQEQEERKRQEQEERERQEQEERERQEQEERERQEQEERERQEQEERKRQEQEERKRQEQEERKRQEQEERKRQEQEERERQEQEERERQEQEERERQEQEGRERLEYQSLEDQQRLQDQQRLEQEELLEEEELDQEEMNQQTEQDVNRGETSANLPSTKKARKPETQLEKRSDNTKIRINFKFREEGSWKDASFLMIDPFDPSEVERVAKKKIREKIRLFDTELRMLTPQECYQAVMIDGTYTVLLIRESEIYIDDELQISAMDVRIDALSHQQHMLKRVATNDISQLHHVRKKHHRRVFI